MTDAGRKRLLAVMLFASLGAAAWIATNEDSGSPVRERQERKGASARPAADTSGDQELQLARIAPRPEKSEPKPLFPPQTWTPPPPPPPPPSAAAEAEKRRPPPLPFKYFGGMMENGKPIAFLSRGETDFSVTVGETIDRVYRVEEISEKAIVMTYIPLDARQTLATGEGR